MLTRAAPKGRRHRQHREHGQRVCVLDVLERRDRGDRVGERPAAHVPRRRFVRREVVRADDVVVLVRDVDELDPVRAKDLFQHDSGKQVRN